MQVDPLMLAVAQNVASSARSLSAARAGLGMNSIAAPSVGARKAGMKAEGRAMCDVCMIFKTLSAMRRHLEHDRVRRAAISAANRLEPAGRLGR